MPGHQPGDATHRHLQPHHRAGLRLHLQGLLHGLQPVVAQGEEDGVVAHGQVARVVAEVATGLGVEHVRDVQSVDADAARLVRVELHPVADRFGQLPGQLAQCLLDGGAVLDARGRHQGVQLVLRRPAEIDGRVEHAFLHRRQQHAGVAGQELTPALVLGRLEDLLESVIDGRPQRLANPRGGAEVQTEVGRRCGGDQAGDDALGLGQRLEVLRQLRAGPGRQVERHREVVGLLVHGQARRQAAAVLQQRFQREGQLVDELDAQLFLGRRLAGLAALLEVVEAQLHLAENNVARVLGDAAEVEVGRHGADVLGRQDLPRRRQLAFVQRILVAGRGVEVLVGEAEVDGDRRVLRREGVQAVLLLRLDVQALEQIEDGLLVGDGQHQHAGAVDAVGAEDAVEAEGPLAVETLQPLVADHGLQKRLALLRLLLVTGLRQDVAAVGEKVVEGRHADDHRRRSGLVVGWPCRRRDNCRDEEGEETNESRAHERTPFSDAWCVTHHYPGRLRWVSEILQRAPGPNDCLACPTMSGATCIVVAAFARTRVQRASS